MLSRFSVDYSGQLKFYVRGKSIVHDIPMHTWGTSQWARELTFLQMKEQEIFWFIICNKNWLFSFLICFFQFQKKKFFPGSFLLSFPVAWANNFRFSITLSWRAYQPWSSNNFSYDVLCKKNLAKISSKVRFLIFPKLTSSEYQKSGPPNGQNPPSIQFYLMHNI